LKSEKQFKKNVLRNLEILKSGIDSFEPNVKEDKNIKDLMLIAFSAIIIDCSNLKRSPCLGYYNKSLNDNSPMIKVYSKIKIDTFKLF
jgi:hypothetical protein